MKLYVGVIELMITIERMSPSYSEFAIVLGVDPEQLPYVGTMTEILANVSEACHPHVVLVSELVVGFFLIDTAYSAGYDFCDGQSLGLRAFFIDKKHQGQGYGLAATAVLKPYLHAHYADYYCLYLTVNCKNPAAYHCYKKAGFADTEKVYLGGAAGPQHIMFMTL